MLRWLIPAFVLVPLLELYLLLALSRMIGFGATVALTLLTGVLGGTLAKREGLRVWQEWTSALHEMRAPAAGVIDGVLVLVGGVFLLTPGVLTDITGVLLLFAPTRRLLAARMRAAVDRRIASGHIRVVNVMDTRGGPPNVRDVQVIDTTGESADRPRSS